MGDLSNRILTPIQELNILDICKLDKRSDKNIMDLITNRKIDGLKANFIT